MTASAVSEVPRHAAADAGRQVELHRRRVYILPTRHGYLFAFTLFLMLLGSINYNNSMAFVLTFLLAGLALNAMWSTHRNLLGLVCTEGHVEPVFAGQVASFAIAVRNPSSMHRHTLTLAQQKHPATVFNVPPAHTRQVEVRVPATHRGRLQTERFLIETRYPMGLFRAWSWLNFEMSTIVYPTPKTMPVKETFEDAAGAELQGARSDDDYSGLREYQPSDSPHHIAWKASARSEALLVKTFDDGSRASTMWLNWDTLAGHTGEQRLSIMCDWVLSATRADKRFGLRLPGVTVDPQRGTAHKLACLQILALYTLPEENQQA